MTQQDTRRFRDLFTGGGILFAGLVAELGLSLFSKIIIARYLGKVDYGGIALGATIVAMSSTIVLAGMHTGVARFLPRFEDPDDRHGIIYSAFAIVGGFSLALASGIFVLAPTLAETFFHNSEIAPVLAIFALAIPVSALMRVSIGVSQGYQQTLPKVLARNISFPIVRFGGVAIVATLGFGPLGIAGSYVLAYALSACIGVWYVVRKTAFSISVPERFHTASLMSFSAPLLLSSVLTLVLSDIDTLMLGYFATEGDVGVYNVVYPIGVLLLAFLRSFRFLYLPEISELDAAESYASMRRQYYLVAKWIFLTTTPVFAFVVVYPDIIIQTLFGAEYTSGDLALVLLTGGFYIHAVLGLNGTTLTSIGQTRLILLDNLVAAGANIALNLWLIPRYGFVGAAIATTASYVLINVLYSVQLYRLRSIWPTTTRITLAAGLVMALTGMWAEAEELLQPTLGSIIALTVMFGLCYILIVMGVIGMEDEETDLALRAKNELRAKVAQFFEG
ncbi:flippase [Natrinema hispanicum]|uniref:Membrane protein involved in the export of O-antigen and teichoic acid n=1 Tax=Natrinema hispanicum TaxID=392421 RepID=A0A1G6URI4_9EURY|nr:flippase [Natrinema hispanicum]SDD44018.1 Membrane protein involved in the export of O-antigen and teichoic acid [Natrinema hispanicum]